MKRLEVKNLHIIEELKREIRKTKDRWYSLRLRCIHTFLHNYTKKLYNNKKKD